MLEDLAFLKQAQWFSRYLIEKGERKLSTTKNPFGLPPFQSALILKLYLRDKVQAKFSCAKKETVDIDILVASRKGDRKIMECTLIFL